MVAVKAAALSNYPGMNVFSGTWAGGRTYLTDPSSFCAKSR